jgi:hypothetical protein
MAISQFFMVVAVVVAILYARHKRQAETVVGHDINSLLEVPPPPPPLPTMPMSMSRSPTESPTKPTKTTILVVSTSTSLLKNKQ